MTPLTLCSFFLMVGSSVIAAWADISTTLSKLSAGVAVVDPISGADVPLSSISVLDTMNVGYLWMFINCLASAGYVLFMRKRIKVTGFKDWDSMFYNNLLSIPVLFIFSLVIEDWGAASFSRNLYVSLFFFFPPPFHVPQTNKHTVLKKAESSFSPLSPFPAPPPSSSHIPPHGASVSAARRHTPSSAL